MALSAHPQTIPELTLDEAQNQIPNTVTHGAILPFIAHGDPHVSRTVLVIGEEINNVFFCDPLLGPLGQLHPNDEFEVLIRLRYNKIELMLHPLVHHQGNQWGTIIASHLF